MEEQHSRTRRAACGGRCNSITNLHMHHPPAAPGSAAALPQARTRRVHAQVAGTHAVGVGSWRRARAVALTHGRVGCFSSSSLVAPPSSAAGATRLQEECLAPMTVHRMAQQRAGEEPPLPFAGSRPSPAAAVPCQIRITLEARAQAASQHTPSQSSLTIQWEPPYYGGGGGVGRISVPSLRLGVQ